MPNRLVSSISMAQPSRLSAIGPAILLTATSVRILTTGALPVTLPPGAPAPVANLQSPAGQSLASGARLDRA